MTLLERINDDLKDAMRARDEHKLSALRMVRAAIKKTEDAKISAQYDAWAKKTRGTPEEANTPDFRGQAAPLEEAEVLSVIAKEVKERKDSLAEFQKANRQELVKKEELELAILMAYLPAQLSRDDIAAAVKAVIQQLGATGPSDKGKVMPLIMGQLRGKAEGAEINAVVTELLAAL